MAAEEAAEAAEGSVEADDAVAHTLEQMKALALENDELRRQHAEQRHAHIALLEVNRELQWRLDALSDSAAAGEPPSERDWRDVDAKLQLLLTENNLLEARAREASEEAAAHAQSMHELQLAVAHAHAAAERAQEEAADAEARRVEAETRAEAAVEREREAERRSAESTAAIGRLQRELEEAREQVLRAHCEAAEGRHEAERWNAHVSAGMAEATRREQLADAARVDMAAQLQEYKQRIQAFEDEWMGTDRIVQGHLEASENLSRELQLSQDSVQRLEAGLAQCRGALERASVREAQLQGEVKQLSARLEQQAEMLARQAKLARTAAYETSQAGVKQLEEARAAAQREAQAMAERELRHARTLEDVHSKLERELRERRALQRQLEEAQAVAAARSAERAEVAAAGDPPLRAEVAACRRRAEEAEHSAQRLQAQLRQAADEMARLRARAEGADAEAQRAEIRGRRAAAQAEAERDAMALRLAQRAEAADSALAEVAQMEGRLHTEHEAIRRHCEQETGRLRQRNEGLMAQLDDAVQAAAQLQDLLSAQQQLAEAYRHEARVALEQLSEMSDLGPVSHRRQHQSLQQLRDEISREQNSKLSSVQTMLEAMQLELQATRGATEEQQRRVQTAQLLVL
ncbi:hypothetical protein AB1Y20_019737 [Prymnesium parvum]|uniref:Uncharacterized protein n=1 Tax=Prymnesium parvum TaxID=97485 RepID=A0AB34JUW0_PRYPA